METMHRWIAGCCSVADVTARAESVSNLQLEEAFKDVTPALLSLHPDTLSLIGDHAQHTKLQRLLLLAYQCSIVDRQYTFSQLLLPADTTGMHTRFMAALQVGDNSTATLQRLEGGTELDADEVHRRVGRGEIIDRGEWIPGISEGKRMLTASELKEFLEFSEVLFGTGREAWLEKDLEKALTMYTQGVHLLEWVDGEGVESTLLRFLKNQSLLALKTERYQEAKTAARRACELAPNDLKAQYRHAEALYHLGELEEAVKLYRGLVNSEASDVGTKAAAAQGLRRLQATSTKWKTDFAFYSATATAKGTFGDGREDAVTREPSPVGTPTAGQLKAPRTDPISLSQQVPSKPYSGPSTPPLDLITLQGTLQLLTTMKQVYTSAEFEDRMRLIRTEADFDELKTLKRLQKHLPYYLGPVFKSCGLTGDFSANKKKMDMSIQYWRPHDADVGRKSKELYSIVLGDSCED